MNRTAVAAATTFLLLLVAAAPAGAASLDRSIDRIVAAPGGPPGVSVLLQRGGRTEFHRAGVADVRTKRPPTADDHMRIASMAKAYSGAVTLSLASAGQLRVDETIGERLPGVLPLANPVTLGQALQHTGGLPDYIRTKAFLKRFIKDPAAYMSPAELIDFVRGDPLEFTPGSRYHYSDTDNIVAGLMAEAATGRSYESLLSSVIYDPLGLHQTTLPRTTAMPKPYLHGYEIAPGKAPDDVSKVINPAGAWASGGIVSTPREVGRFFRAYVSGRFFDAATREAQGQFRPGASSPPGPGRNAAGLAVFRYQTRCGTVYGHTGSFPGYRLFAASSADGKRSVVFSVNAQIVPGQGSQKVAAAIRRAQTQAVCRVLR
jgi:D-alanyl-D-alanine carboxypeptidase